MSKYDIKKLNDDYDLLDNNEKLAMRYGAEGRDLSDVIRSSTKKITSPNKIFDVWDKGTNMRKDGTSRDFLERIEKKEMDDLLTSINKKKDANGISAEPVKDIWGNDLLNDTRKNRKKEGASAEKMPYIADFDNPVKPQPMPRVNNALSNTKDYDIMYLSEPSDSTTTSAPKAKTSVKEDYDFWDFLKDTASHFLKGWFIDGRGVNPGEAFFEPREEPHEKPYDEPYEEPIRDSSGTIIAKNYNELVEKYGREQADMIMEQNKV